VQRPAQRVLGSRLSFHSEVMVTERRKASYRIRVHGHLDEDRSEWFAGLTITPLPSGETLLAGEIEDQSALNAVLNALHALGIKLHSVERVDPQDPEGNG
jgi:hypothetical protein